MSASAAVQQQPPLNTQLSTKYLAVCAQTVLIGSSAKSPMVVRVSVTDYRGEKIIDTFVQPRAPMTYRMYSITGLTAEHFSDAPSLSIIQRQVAELIQGKIIVGYELWIFLSLMEIPHPAIDTRDVAVFIPFWRSLNCRSIVPLPALVSVFMGQNIGYKCDHPLENARAALDLFRSYVEMWEGIIQSGSWPSFTPSEQYAHVLT